MFPSCCGADILSVELRGSKACVQHAWRPGTQMVCWLQQGVAGADMHNAEPQKAAASSTCDAHHKSDQL